MGKKLWLVLLGVAVGTLLFIAGAKASAFTQFKSGNSANVPAGTTIDSSMWSAARTIDIAGTINGDLYCAGQTVTISGLVKGDVICAAQTFNISGQVQGNMRLAGGTINLSGQVSGSTTMAGGTINADSKSKIYVDASMAAHDLNLNGQIGRDLAAAGTTLNINGRIGRDVSSRTDSINLSANAKVGGGISYTSNNSLNRESGAQVTGSVTHDYPKKDSRQWVQLFLFGGAWAFVLAVVLIISALVVTAIFPQAVHAVSTQAINRPWLALLTGFSASIIAPVVGVLLLITVIGIPLAIVFFVAWVLLAILSGVFTAYYVGRRLWRSQTNALLRVLVGSAILMVLYLIPFISFIFMLVAFWMGVGMALLELKHRLPSPKYSLK